MYHLLSQNLSNEEMFYRLLSLLFTLALICFFCRKRIIADLRRAFFTGSEVETIVITRKKSFSSRKTRPIRQQVGQDFYSLDTPNFLNPQQINRVERIG